MFKVIVAGGRLFNDYNLLCIKLDALLRNKVKDGVRIAIVCGLAKGADELGRKYAIARGYQVLEFPANWDLHGKSAGYKRNEQMANAADALVAFWDGNSKGTKHMIDIMRSKGRATRIVSY